MQLPLQHMQSDCSTLFNENEVHHITRSLGGLAAIDVGMHMQVQEHYTIQRPQYKTTRKWSADYSATYWPLWASFMPGINEEAHLFFAVD